MNPWTLVRIVPLALVVALATQGLSFTGGIGQARAAGSTGSQKLHFATAPGYRLAAAGKGWPGSDPLTFTLRTGNVARQIVLRTTPAGTFMVAMMNVNVCAGIAITARDGAGRHATLIGPHLACPTPRVVPVPTLKVLHGSLLPPPSSPSNQQGQNGAWQTYRNPEAGYSVEYPANWNVHESPRENASYITAFLAPDGSGSILVSVRPGTADGGLDVPNTRCHPVQIGTLSGTQCIDTIGFTQSTTLVSSGKTFTISMSLKRSPADVYEHMVASFRPLP